MKKYFSTPRQIVRTVHDAFNLEQFKAMLNEHKPTEIFNSHYSDQTPCWYITEYVDEHTVKYYANGWSDKTPLLSSMEDLHNSWMIQGMDQCFLKLEKTENGTAN